MALAWLRSPFARRTRTGSKRSTQRKPIRNRMVIEELETRLVPSATALLGGLEFSSANGFTTTPTANGNQISATGPVQVGVAPSAGNPFNALLQLDGGVQFLDGDPNGTFGTDGSIEALLGNQSLALLGNGPHTFQAGDLLNGIGSLSGGQDISVAGLDFVFANLQLTDQSIELQGSLTLPKLDGLSLSVTGNDRVVLDDTGAHLTGLDVSLNNVSFETAGVNFTADTLNVHYTAPTSTTGAEFSLAGSGSATLAGNKVGLQLGTPNNPGIVIDNGTLEQFDATVTTPTLTVGPLTLNASSLELTYTAASADNGNVDTFTVAGNAGFTLDGNTVELQLGDTQEGTKGLVIQNGALTSFDAAVTGHIDIGGLEINADSLRASYQAASTANNNTETIAITGAADIAVDGNTVDLQLGNDTTQGIVIQNGQLVSLDASVSADLDLFGLSIKATDLTVAYVAPTSTSPESVEVYGSLDVSTSDGHLQDIAANLGTADNPGLDLVNGQVTHLNIGLTGSFDLFGVTIEADGLTVAYDSGTHLLNLSGGATVSLTSAISGSVNFPDGGLTIDTQTGNVQINGLELKFDVSFGGFGIHDLDIKYTSVNGDTTFAASGSVEFPGGFAVGGSLALHNGQLTDISFSFDAGAGAGIPLGDTGLFITHVDGGLHHLDDLSQLTVDVGLGLTLGEQVSFLGHTYSLFSVLGTIQVSARELDLTGTINLLGGVYGSGTASVKLDWADQIYSVSLNVGIYDDTIDLAGTFLINGSGDITLNATASAELPETIGNLFGNHAFLTGTATVEIEPQLDPSQSYVDLTLAVPGIGQAEVKYDFANHLHIDAHASLLGQTAELVGNVNPDGTFTLSGAFNVSILGSTLNGTITADNNGFHVTGNLYVLGQTVYVHGDVFANGTFDLSGVISINAGIQFNANFTADNNGFHANGSFYALGSTVYVSGWFTSNGQFALSGSTWVDVAGEWIVASFSANNYGVQASGTFWALGQYAYVYGNVYASGYFDLNGGIWINILGNSAYATFSADNYGFHASAWDTLLGQSVYVHGDIYSSGWFSYTGNVWIGAGGFGFWGNFTADNNGVHVNSWVYALGQSVNVQGDIYYGGWFDFYGSIGVDIAGWWLGASLAVDPNGLHASASFGFWGVTISVWGDIWNDGNFSLGTSLWGWSVWVDPWGLHWSW